MKTRFAGILSKRCYQYLLVLWLLILAADQTTKAVVRANMTVGQSIPADTPVRLTYVQNTGSAFGLFTNQTLFLTIAAAS